MQIDGQTLPKIWIYICQLWIFVAVGALIMVGVMGSIGFECSLGSDILWVRIFFPPRLWRCSPSDL
jgi:purine-nucleoside phosphorylase